MPLAATLAPGFVQEKSTPTIWAAYEGHLEVLDYLVSKGANYVKGNKVPDSVGNPCRHVTITCSAVSQEGNSPIIAATFHGRLDIVERLLELGVSIETTNKVRNRRCICWSGVRA